MAAKAWEHTFAGLPHLGRNLELRRSPEVVFRDVADLEEINESAWRKRIERFDEIEGVLVNISKETGSHFISKYELVCPDRKCTILIGEDMGYVDSGHWSEVGMKYYGAALVNHEEFQLAMGEGGADNAGVQTRARC